jgi:transposase
MNIQEATPIELTAEERAVLEGMVRSPKTEQRLAKRARVVLLAADHLSTRQIARTVGFSIGKASQWRGRFARDRLSGLQDKPRCGSKPIYTVATGRRILAKLNEPPPAGYARWTAPLLSQALADVSDQYIWRFLRAQKIDLSGRKSWCESPDPAFAAKAAEIVGLYLDPPDKAVVLALDEKPSIQALERKQGYLKLANGRSLAGHGHTYTRHGTTTLFAALEVATGTVRVAHYQRRRRIEFLDFMNQLVAAYPGRQLHVVLDNLSTHKPKRERWLKRHPNVHFHFTPTYASWLNQVEIWFSKLVRDSLGAASFTSPRQVREQIDAYIERHNQNPKPFLWTAARVYQKPLKPRFRDL